MCCTNDFLHLKISTSQNVKHLNIANSQHCNISDSNVGLRATRIPLSWVASDTRFCVIGDESRLGQHVLLVHGQLLQWVIERPAVALVEASNTLAVREPDARCLAQSFDVVIGGHLVSQEERLTRLVAVGDPLARDQLLDDAQTGNTVGLGDPRRLQVRVKEVDVERVIRVGRHGARADLNFVLLKTEKKVKREKT